MKVVVENRNTCLLAPSEIVLKVKKSSKVTSILAFLSEKYYVPAMSISLYSDSVLLTEDSPSALLEAPNKVGMTVNFPASLFTEIKNTIKHRDNDKFWSLLVTGCDLGWNLEHIKDYKGWSLIHYACKYNASIILKNLCVTYEKSLNLVAGNGWTPLIIAISKGYLDLVNTIVKFKKLKINKVTSKGTALHVAVEKKQLEIVKVLLSNKSDVRVEDFNGKTCMELHTTHEILEAIAFSNGHRVVSQSFTRKISDLVYTVHRATEKFSKDYSCVISINLSNGRFEEFLFNNDNSHYENIVYKKKIIKLEAIHSSPMPLSEEKFYFKLIFPGKVLKYWVVSERRRDEIVEKVKITSEYCRWKEIGIRPMPEKQEFGISSYKKLDLECPYPKQVSLKEFIKLDLLGSGSFGVVHLIKHKFTGELFALKSSKRDESSKKKKIKYAVTECEILSTINSPFIVKLFWAIATKKHLHLILEYCQGDDLMNIINIKGSFNEHEARFAIASIVLGLQYLHNKGIVCRDLKPANILVESQGYLKICDFGLAQNRVEGEKMNAKLMGSPCYVSPEGIINNKVGKKCDVWALGVSSYQIMTGQLPFIGACIDDLYDKVLANEPKYPVTLSLNCKMFIKFLLQSDPKSRPSIEQVMQHEFFSGIDWKVYAEKKYEAPDILIGRKKSS